MTGTSSAPTTGDSGIARWLGFAALCAGMFMAVLDIQIVVTSLAVIEKALAIGTERMSWVQTAYLIAEVIAIPLTGLLTRVFSLRWLVTGAVALFTVASLGCAASTGFDGLIAFRVVQGLAGGVLIPAVFSAVFLLFSPGFEQTVATTLAGVIAVLAPVLGPIAGGVITENFSWHWLFLINVLPGLLTSALAVSFLPREAVRLGLLTGLDWLSLLFIAMSLASLEIGLKEAPDRGWTSPVVAGLLLIFAGLMSLAIQRPKPIIDFSLLKDRNLAFGSAMSFVLGVGLYGSVYLLPVFLAYVRHHGPVQVGLILLVTGTAQLIAAPISVYLDKHCDSRLLGFAGFGGFTLGLAMSGFEIRTSDYDELFWAQVVRGSAVALCILPITRFAIGYLPLEKVSEASGLYNLSRNLGGAIGIALVDTVLFSRTPEHAARIAAMLKTGTAAAAPILGIPPAELPKPGEGLGILGMTGTIQEASLTLAVNEAWLMLAGLTAIALLLLWALGPIRVPGGASRGDTPANSGSASES